MYVFSFRKPFVKLNELMNCCTCHLNSLSNLSMTCFNPLSYAILHLKIAVYSYQLPSALSYVSCYSNDFH